jgi:ADP-ribose pyrophosphatase
MEIQRPKSNQPIPKNAKKVFKGIVFDVYQWEQEMFDGSKAIFEKLKRPDTVVILPILPTGEIILIEEKQPGSESVIGIPGGRIDKGEEVLEAAKRELLEETGYEAEKFILWDAQQIVNKIDWVIYVFIAKGLKKVADLKLDAGEKITLKPVTFEEFINIGTDTNARFIETEILPQLLEAKLDPKKKEELRKLLSPE